MWRSKPFWIGAISAIAACGLLSIGIIFSGVIPMGAAQEAGPIDLIGNTLFRRAVAVRAGSGTAPTSGEARETGLRRFGELCLPCHGAPGEPPARWVTGMLPRPPLLSSRHVQDWSDGELFHIVSHGIRMTGMPAFSDDLRTEELWHLVAAIRAMPDLNSQDRAALDVARRGASTGQKTATQQAKREQE